MSVASLLLQAALQPRGARATWGSRARSRSGPLLTAASALRRRASFRVRDRALAPRLARGAHELALPLRVRAALHARCPRPRSGGPRRSSTSPSTSSARSSAARVVALALALVPAGADRAALRARRARLARRARARAGRCTAATSGRSSRACSTAACASTRPRSSTPPHGSRSPRPATWSARRCCGRSRRSAAAWPSRSTCLRLATSRAGVRSRRSARLGPPLARGRRRLARCLRSAPPPCARALRRRPELPPVLVAGRCRCSRRRCSPTCCARCAGGAARHRPARRRASRPSRRPARAPARRARAEGLPVRRARPRGCRPRSTTRSFEVRAAAAAALAAIHERSCGRAHRRATRCCERVRRELDSGEPSTASSPSSSRCSRSPSSGGRSRSPGPR